MSPSSWLTLVIPGFERQRRAVAATRSDRPGASGGSRFCAARMGPARYAVRHCCPWQRGLLAALSIPATPFASARSAFSGTPADHDGFWMHARASALRRRTRSPGLLTLPDESRADPSGARRADENAELSISRPVAFRLHALGRANGSFARIGRCRAQTSTPEAAAANDLQSGDAAWCGCACAAAC